MKSLLTKPREAPRWKVGGTSMLRNLKDWERRKKEPKARRDGFNTLKSGPGYFMHGAMPGID